MEFLAAILFSRSLILLICVFWLALAVGLWFEYLFIKEAAAFAAIWIVAAIGLLLLAPRTNAFIATQSVLGALLLMYLHKEGLEL